MLTLMAIEPREAALELTAAQEALEGLMYKAREWLTLVSESVVELGEVASHRSIEWGELRSSALVCLRTLMWVG